VRHCDACADTGLVPYKKTASRVYGRPEVVVVPITVDMVALCLCSKGVVKGQAGVPCASVGAVFNREELDALYPHGIPDGVTADYTDALRQAGIPERRLTWTTATFARDLDPADGDVKKFVTWAAEWIHTDSHKRSDLVLFGPTGTGKTGIGTAMAHGVIKAGGSARVTTLKELSIEWRSSFTITDPSRRQIHESDVIAGYADPDVLLIDEWGGTERTAFLEDSLTFLIDKRQSANKATILTLNVPHTETTDRTFADLTDLFGPRLMDRLRERAQFWPMTGQSRREPPA